MLRVLTLSSVLISTLMACPSPDVMPLIGEGPEIYALLEAPAPDDPTASPLEAARRLHQSLMQNDSDMVWALLAAPTRRSLDERGAQISASGRELLDASTLPGPGNTVRKVRFESILFGRQIVDLKDGPADATTTATRRQVLAVSQNGTVNELTFVREEDGWKLLKTGF